MDSMLKKFAVKELIRKKCKDLSSMFAWSVWKEDTIRGRASCEGLARLAQDNPFLICKAEL